MLVTDVGDEKSAQIVTNFKSPTAKSPTVDERENHSLLSLFTWPFLLITYQFFTKNCQSLGEYPKFGHNANFYISKVRFFDTDIKKYFKKDIDSWKLDKFIIKSILIK